MLHVHIQSVFCNELAKGDLIDVQNHFPYKTSIAFCLFLFFLRLGTI